jgi:hypothetical protein
LRLGPPGRIFPSRRMAGHPTDRQGPVNAKAGLALNRGPAVQDPSAPASKHTRATAWSWPSARSSASARWPPPSSSLKLPGHDPFSRAPHPASWAKFAPGVSESAGKKIGQERHQPRRPLPRPRSRRGGRLARPAPIPFSESVTGGSPADGAKESHRRGRPLNSGHHLAPDLRPQRPLHRPRPRLLRQPDQQQPRDARPCLPAPSSATKSPSNQPLHTTRPRCAAPGTAARPAGIGEFPARG